MSLPANRGQGVPVTRSAWATTGAPSSSVSHLTRADASDCSRTPCHRPPAPK